MKFEETGGTPGMGHVVNIFVAPAARVAVRAVASASAVVGRGLEGDRYFLGVGAFSRWPGEGRQITLIEAEAIEHIEREAGVSLADGSHRRNVVTAGVSLNTLVGRRFRVGPVLLRGQRLCAPCKYLDRLIGTSVYEPMKTRGGLRAEILEGGVLTVNDLVSTSERP